MSIKTTLTTCILLSILLLLYWMHMWFCIYFFELTNELSLSKILISYSFINKFRRQSSILESMDEQTHYERQKVVKNHLISFLMWISNLEVPDVKIIQQVLLIFLIFYFILLFCFYYSTFDCNHFSYNEYNQTSTGKHSHIRKYC